MKTPLIVALGVCACSSSTSGEGAIGQADTQVLGASLGAELEDGALTYGRQDGVDNTGTLVVTPDDSCITVTSFDDPDGDEIPTNTTLTYNCTSTANGVTATLAGTLNIMDTEPTTPAWAFTGQANLHATLTGGPAGIDVTRTGTLTATQTGSNGPYGLERAFAVNTEVTVGGAAAVAVDAMTDWDLAFTPSSEWGAFDDGVAGSLTASGDWSVSIGARTAVASLATAAPLTLDQSCATRIIAGAATATWNDGANTDALTVTWTGCGTRTATFASE